MRVDVSRCGQFLSQREGPVFWANHVLPVSRRVDPGGPVAAASLGAMYGDDVLAGSGKTRHERRRRVAVPEVDIEPEMVVEDADSGFCGAVMGFQAGAVVLEDRKGRRRTFPLEPGAFRFEGRPGTLVRPTQAGPASAKRTASGSLGVNPSAAVFSIRP